jgi:AAA+ ATPase superfamily predicted ATPase
MFIGREDELRSLKNLSQKLTSSLVVITGRRRIGKSSLVKEFAKTQERYLEFAGLPPSPSTSKQDQLDEFIKQLQSQTKLRYDRITDWSDAFRLLADEAKKGEVLIFLDEITWMGSMDHTFLGKLKNAWDLHFKANKRLTLILCGSISAWIDKNILSSTGFLGRVSLEIILEELPLHCCNEFWGSTRDRVTAYEKLKLLSVTGGVPRYLEEIQPELTAEENIQNLCFNRQGILYKEFDRIFSDLFDHSYAIYRDIVRLLVKGPLTLADIYKGLDRSKNVHITETLDNLEKSGFIERNFTWNLKGRQVSKLSKFRISDNYIRFYLKYIEPNKHLIEKGLFEFRDLSLLPSWLSIMGLQFEQLAINNYKTIHRALNINPLEILSSNPFFQTKTKGREGCQIDYLIHTRFDTLYVCEIKFSRKPIGAAIVEEVEEKLSRLKKPKGFSVRPVLITVNEVSDELLSLRYFDKIIYFEEFLKPTSTA